MAPFTWPVQAIALLPEALRPGVLIVLIVLVLWFALVRRGVPDLWRATCRGLARLIDFSVGAVLRLEYAITTGRRRQGKAPPRWAFALAGVTDVVQDGAEWLYGRHQRPAAKKIQQDEDAGEEHKKPMSPVRKSRVPWLLCTGIMLIFTAAWITMDQLSETDIAKYRLARVFDPWRDVEEWAGVDSGRGVQPELVRARRHHTLMNVRIACPGPGRCRGWVLLQTPSDAVVVVHYVELPPGSMIVQLRLTSEELRATSHGHLVVVRL
jgi:hypothetical protein